MNSSLLRFASLSLAFVCGVAGLNAQSPVAALRPVPQSNRVTAGAYLSPQTQLSGHLPRWVSNGNQVASQAVDLSANLRITIVLARDPAVQAAFEHLLADQQNPSSPHFHQWLTPQQVGTLYGPTVSDVAAVTSWLTSQDLTVDSIVPSQMLINLHGTAAAVGNAFGTSFAYFPLNGTPRLSAVSEPSIPTALAPVIKSIAGLTDLPLNPLSYHTPPQQAAFGPADPSNPTVPLPMYTGSGGVHYLTPNDFAVIYDINSVYAANITGAIGLRVAIIGRSRIATTDITEWATNVGLTNYTLPNVIIPTSGVDPGAVCTFSNAATCATANDQGEQTLDVDRVIGTAPGVLPDLIVATNASGGIELAAQYNVSMRVDPIMTISYGACELNAGATAVNQWDTIFSDGAAVGISTFVASGDSGANACAPDGNATTTTYTASMNYICSSSYATCVGATEFADTASPSTYWSSSNGTGNVSALSYIPEGGRNEPGTSTPYQVLSSGGGPSQFIAKPTWQTGTGVPADGHRDTPDIAMAGALHDGFYTCLDFQLGLYTSMGITSSNNCTTAGGGYFFGEGGTSAAAPSMAGIAALLSNKFYRINPSIAGQGNLNPLLYKIAAQSNTPFHDITVASSGVGACDVTVPSMCNNSTPGASANSTSDAGGLQGYQVTAGYDEVTGLGSLDVANFLTSGTLAAASFSISTIGGQIPGSAGTNVQESATIASLDGFSGTVNFTCSTDSPSILNCSGGSVTLANGGNQTLNFNVMPVGHASGTVGVTLTGTGTTAGSTIPATVSLTGYITVNRVATSTTMVASPTTVTVGTPITLTATVVPSSNNGTLTGTVTFNITGNGVSATLPATVTYNGTFYTATATYTPTIVGQLQINPVYGGDAGYNSSDLAVALQLYPSSFEVSVPNSPIDLTSGATSGNTVPVVIPEFNSFTGTVNLTCTVTTVTGTAAGSCSLNPNSVNLAPSPAPAGNSTLSLITTPGTSGTLNMTVTGTSGSTIATSPVIPVVLTAPYFLMSSAPATIILNSGNTSGNTSVVTFTSQLGFAGTVNVTCSTSNVSGTAAGTCIPSPATVTLTSGGTATSTMTLNSTAGTSGILTETVTGIGTTTGATLAYSGTATVTASLTAQNFTFAASPTSISVTSGATTGNTSVVTFASLNGFAGAVNVSCTAANTSGSASGSCAASPSSITLTAGGSATTIVTFTSTAGTSGTMNLNVTGTSGSSTGSLVIVATLSGPSFTLTPVPSTLNIPSGATTGNTSVVAVASINGFAGTVNLGCAISPVSGNVTGSCAASPASVTLTSGGTATSTVTLTSTAGTSGILTENIFGSGSTTGSSVVQTASATVTANLSAGSFTMSASPASISLTSGNSSSSVLTVTSVNGFSGVVSIGCSGTTTSGNASGFCTASPSSVTLVAGGTATSNISIGTVPGTSGGVNLNLLGNGINTGASGTTIAGTQIFLTLTSDSFTASASPAAITVVSGATTGNTSTVTFTSVNGFSGSINVTCAATNTSGNASGSCASVLSPITLPANGTASVAIVFTSTPGTSGTMNLAVTGTWTGAGSILTASLPSPIVATLVSSSFTLAASPTSISIPGNATTGNTTSVLVTSVNGFGGTVTVGCSSSAPSIASCTGGSAAVTPSTPGHVTITVTPVLHSSGTATLTLSASGTTTGATIAATASATVPLTVTTVASTTAVVATPSTVVAGSPSMLTATVVGTSANGNPTGTVTFFANGTAITGGVTTLSSTGGVTMATYIYTPTIANSTPIAITAVYGGDSGYAASTSSSTNLTATGFSTGISGTTTSITLTSGSTTGNTAQFSFNPIGAFTGTVNLTCSISGGAAMYPPTCSLNPASFTLTPGTPQISMLTIFTTTPHAITGDPEQAFASRTGGVILALLVCMLPFHRRRFIRPLMVVFFLMGALTALSGCGSNSGAAPVPPGSQGSYIITVTGTSGTETVSTTIPLTVN